MVTDEYDVSKVTRQKFLKPRKTYMDILPLSLLLSSNCDTKTLL
jgi:hypothetical protein